MVNIARTMGACGISTPLAGCGPTSAAIAKPRPEAMDVSVLFVDLRSSSKIVRYVESSHGPVAAAELFTSYLAGCTQAIMAVSDAECQLSGDAVLAIISGPERQRIAQAVTAAAAAIRFVSEAFEPTNRHLLSCRNGCRPWRQDALRFRVVAGIDDGVATKSEVEIPGGYSTEFVGGCVSTAAKLSDRIGPANAIGITTDAYRRGGIGQSTSYKWRGRVVRIGGRFRHIQATVPPRP
jgi:class 3 adenylate cyclase